MQHVKNLTPTPVWNLAKSVVRSNKNRPQPLTGELRREIAQYYHEDTLKLQELVELDLSDWLEK